MCQQLTRRLRKTQKEAFRLVMFTLRLETWSSIGLLVLKPFIDYSKKGS